jgi:hypothetical protein
MGFSLSDWTASPVMGDGLFGLGGPVVPQSSTPVTDLSAHVTGGTASKTFASGTAQSMLYVSAGIVFAALAILWASGTIVFKGARI